MHRIPAKRLSQQIVFQVTNRSRIRTHRPAAPFRLYLIYPVLMEHICECSFTDLYEGFQEEFTRRFRYLGRSRFAEHDRG